MKKTLVILFLLFSYHGFAQSNQTQGSPNTIIVNRGALKVDSILYVPVRGDNAWFGDYGNIRINAGTGNLEYRKNNAWIEVSASTGGTNFKQEEFAGDTNYTLSNTPIPGTVIVSINGIEVPTSWVNVSGANVTITVQSPFSFTIINTDKIRIKYFH